MKLPVPIFCDDKIYNMVEIKRPRTHVITKAYEAIQKGNLFRATLEFISGCIETISDGEEIIDTPAKIRQLCFSMPYMSAEMIAIKSMSMINKDDVVEGVYSCPRCQTKYITEYDSILDIDNRDKISELEIINMPQENYNNKIEINLDEPIKLINKQTKEILQEINSFSIKYPTLKECINAGQNMQSGQEAKVQIKLYIDSLIEINKTIITKQWTATWGKIFFDNLYPEDLGKIGETMQKYGLKRTVKRECNNCGKVWEANINTSNFFVSGLQPF